MRGTDLLPDKTYCDEAALQAAHRDVPVLFSVEPATPLVLSLPEFGSDASAADSAAPFVCILPACAEEQASDAALFCRAPDAVTEATVATVSGQTTGATPGTKSARAIGSQSHVGQQPTIPLHQGRTGAREP